MNLSVRGNTNVEPLHLGITLIGVLVLGGCAATAGVLV